MKLKNLSSAILLALCVLVISPVKIHAQYVFPEKAKCEALKTKTLAVLLLDTVNTEPSMHNDAVRQAYTNEWKVTPVEFVSKEKYDDIVKSGDTKYAVVYPSEQKTSWSHEFGGLEKYKWDRQKNAWSKDPTYKDPVRKHTYSFSHYDVLLSLVTAPGKSDNITSISFGNSDLLPADFFFAAQQLGLLVNASLNGRTGKEFYDPEKNIEQIKASKFLLPKELFKEKDIPKIGSKYEYPFEVSELFELNKVVLEKNDAYVYPKIIWSNMHRAYGWITVNAKDGALLSFMAFGGIKVGTTTEADEVLKPGQLGDALSKFMQKVNNRYD